MIKVLFRDKRTEVDLEYNPERLGTMEGQRLFIMAGNDIIREVVKLQQSITVDFYLHPWHVDLDFLNLPFVQGSDRQQAEAFGKFAKGKAHVAVCRDWVNSKIYMKEITDEQEAV